MIKVTYEQRNDIFKLSINGHAEYAPHGSDIVCSAVSAIACGLIGLLENNSDHIQEKSIKIHEGKLDLFCVGDEKIETGFEFLLVSLLQIEKKYPQYVNVDARI